MGVEEKCISDHALIYRILRQMHFMPNNDFEGKNILLPKIAFQNLGTTKLHLGSQDPGSRKFSCPGLHNVYYCDDAGLTRITSYRDIRYLQYQLD